jgi:hypothetical protein
MPDASSATARGERPWPWMQMIITCGVKASINCVEGGHRFNARAYDVNLKNTQRSRQLFPSANCTLPTRLEWVAAALPRNPPVSNKTCFGKTDVRGRAARYQLAPGWKPHLCPDTLAFPTQCVLEKEMSAAELPVPNSPGV